MILDRIESPADLRQLSYEDLDQLAEEIRDFIVQTVSVTGGHLGSNLGAVELTLAVHRVFDSPQDVILWDTGHQAYVHKLVTGRRDDFSTLRQAGGLSGYPSRRESAHDWIENSHASTVLSYAHGIASALDLAGRDPDTRRVVAVVGDGALTGGMAYEALNNIGHSERRVVIILNDNGRSYAPTISRLSESLTRVRLSKPYIHARERVGRAVQDLPAVRRLAQSGWSGLRVAVRELFGPNVFFDALGVRYIGPIDGHDIAGLERAMAGAADYDGPIVVHVLTHKGRGYPPAEEDVVQRLHDFKVAPAPAGGSVPTTAVALSYTDAFTAAMLDAAERDARIVAITAAMPGPTGLLPFESRFPDRFVDVGIAEQHAVTAAAGMAMAGLRPVVAVYSTFFTRAFDQAMFDVGLHRLPVVFALDRAGITGPDGPSHHGVLDLALTLKIPGMTVFAPSSAQEVGVMLAEALRQDGPCAIRWPRTAARQAAPGDVGSGLSARLVRRGQDVCMLAVGKMLEAAEEAAAKLQADGVEATVWDVRVVNPPDRAMLEDASGHPLIVTIEDGMRVGGAGSHLADALAALNPGRRCPPVLNLGTPLEFIPHGAPEGILAELGLDGDGVAGSVRRALQDADSYS
ncbi:MAG TPA: 1-deoxy-D-xylulose-5-phosphate synthase [Acidimicrobiales bacterium]|nr:1-deoxy-D-xylulose-5-phosphate synthase [Acidimicrobiales bacterium]